tara:strand:- start:34 stop:1416 length:1383 start_codon:yes stop_codon:yes gene_type:complete
MRIFILIAALIWLLLSWFASSVGLKAEEITTNNLLTNGNFETGNANGWTTNGDVQVLNDCCELNNVSSNYDLEFGDSGSISQDVTLTTNSITQEMLDNGITLSQVTEVQNGECGVAGCWGGTGGKDTFTINLNIKDSSGNVLATMTSTRTDVTDINGQNFTDTLIYTGANSNVANTIISGLDANAPANLGGPNVDNISLTMTYNNVVLQVETQQALKEFEETVIFEKETIEFKEEVQIFTEEIQTIAALPMPEEEKVMEIVAAVMTFEEKTETKVTKAEIKTAVEEKEEKPEMIATQIIEEAEEETSVVKEETKETKSTSEEPTTETVSTENNSKQKKVQSEKKVASKTKKNISANFDKVMAKVDASVKDVSKNLIVKNIIITEAMVGEVSLAAYVNQEFYKPKDIYLGNNLIDNREIYSNVNLASYIANDPVNIKDTMLQDIKIKKQKLLIELEQLKNG